MVAVSATEQVTGRLRILIIDGDLEDHEVGDGSEAEAAIPRLFQRNGCSILGNRRRELVFMKASGSGAIQQIAGGSSRFAPDEGTRIAPSRRGGTDDEVLLLDEEFAADQGAAVPGETDHRFRGDPVLHEGREVVLFVDRMVGVAGAVIPDQHLLIGILVNPQGWIQPTDQTSRHGHGVAIDRDHHRGGRTPLPIPTRRPCGQTIVPPRDILPFHGKRGCRGRPNQGFPVVKVYFRHLTGHLRDISGQDDRRRRAESGAVGGSGQGHARERIEQFLRDARAGFPRGQIPKESRRGGTGGGREFHFQTVSLASAQGDLGAVVPQFGGVIVPAVNDQNAVYPQANSATGASGKPVGAMLWRQNLTGPANPKGSRAHRRDGWRHPPIKLDLRVQLRRFRRGKILAGEIVPLQPRAPWTHEKMDGRRGRSRKAIGDREGEAVHALIPFCWGVSEVRWRARDGPLGGRGRDLPDQLIRPTRGAF